VEYTPVQNHGLRKPCHGVTSVNLIFNPQHARRYCIGLCPCCYRLLDILQTVAA